MARQACRLDPTAAPSSRRQHDRQLQLE